MDTPLDHGTIADSTLSGRVLLGRYQLGERLGHGELGDVYAANDLLRLSIADEAAVAVKVFHDSLVNECGGVRAMAPKLAAACRLSHPHTINAYDFYEDGEALFLAMERLGGMTLAEHLSGSRTGSPQNVTEADAALREVVDALAYIHATTKLPLLRLNPQRLWLGSEDRQVCVVDLGLSSLIDQTLLCQSAMTTGMSAYLAPEVVAEGRAPDCRADQFSLGALAMTLFTASPRGSVEELQKALGRTGPAIWADLLPRLLAEDPDDRFDDLAELQQILLGAPPDKPRKKWRSRSVVLGNGGSARKRGFAGLIRKPQVLAVAGFLGLGLAFSAWGLGPDLLFRDHWKGIATTQIDEARRQLHEIDALRIELLAKGMNRAPFDAVVRRLAPAMPDYALIDSLRMATTELENGDNESAQLRLSSTRASLDERMKHFTDAIAAIDACDRLLELGETAVSLDGVLSIVGDSTPERLEEKWQNAADAIASGEFSYAAERAAEAAEGAEKAFDNALRIRHSEAVEARDAWKVALSGIGSYPEIDPIGEPGKQITIGESARAAGDRIGAARRFAAAHVRYRDWTDELSEADSRADYVDPPASPGAEEPTVSQVAFTNSIGMKFDPVGDLMASIWETRLIDFLAFIYETGVDAGYQWRDFAVTGTSWRDGDDGLEDLANMWGDLSITPIQGPCHPVTMITFADTQRFCEWLTQRERRSGLIRPDQIYRLPSDLEWSLLAGLEDDPGKNPKQRSFDHPSHFPWGGVPVRSASAGNYATWANRDSRPDLLVEQDGFLYTAPVGSFAPNAYGLYDVGGNVWEQTSDNLFGLSSRGGRVVRGGGWRSFDLDTLRTACRLNWLSISAEVGFRVVLVNKKKSDDSEGATEHVVDPNDGNGRD